MKAKVGDRFWTMLLRVTTEESILAASPYRTEHLHIDRSSVIRNIPEISPADIARRTVLEHALFVETTRTSSGSTYAKVLHRDEWPDKCPIDFPGHELPEIDFESKYLKQLKTDREEAIEWSGTDQHVSSESTEKRKKVFSESDIRGSKNNLLGR